MAVNYEKMWRKPQRANRLFKLLVNNNNKQVAATMTNSLEYNLVLYFLVGSINL